jgi:hypothetical protein
MITAMVDHEPTEAMEEYALGIGRKKVHHHRTQQLDTRSDL